MLIFKTIFFCGSIHIKLKQYVDYSTLSLLKRTITICKTYLELGRKLSAATFFPQISLLLPTKRQHTNQYGWFVGEPSYKNGAGHDGGETGVTSGNYFFCNSLVQCRIMKG